MNIRKYISLDRKQIELIHFETGFLGRSMSKLLTDNRLYKKQIGYYLEKESESIFVIEEKRKVTGYLLGCLDDKNNNESINFIVHTIRNMIKSLVLPKKDRVFWRSQFFVLFNIIIGISDELKFKTPKNSGHIHINLLSELRGKGMGTKLLKEFEKYAKQKGVKIIHADSYQTRINPNTNFWIKNGFKVYSSVRTSAWKKQFPKEKISLVCYFKRLA